MPDESNVGLIPEGRYIAEVVSKELREARQSNALGLTIGWSIKRKVLPADVAVDYNGYITDTVWFRKGNGRINTSGMDTLTLVLGWDGDPTTLVDEDKFATSGEYQITIEHEAPNKYHKDPIAKVAWINPADGSIPKRIVTPDRLKQISDEMSEEIRAYMRGERTDNQPTAKGAVDEPLKDEEIPF